MDFEAEIRREFLQEAKELVEQAEEAFLDFEKDTSDLSVIDNIFRLFHTIKGSSYTAGFEQLGSFTHKVENILSSIKANEISINDQVCDVLIRSNDVLADWVNQLEQDHEFIHEGLAELEEQIEVYQKKDDENKAPPLSGFGFFDDDDETVATPAKDLTSDSSSPSEASGSPVTTQASQAKSDQDLANILVVDDEPEIIELISDFLEDMQVRVFTANDGLEGTEVCQKENIDLILTDLRMPKMDGIEFIEEIRKIDDSLPVIFISGAADREDLISFMSLGAHGFLEKPISRKILLNSVSSAVYIKKMKEGLGKISLLNFKLHMSCYQLVSTKDELKRKKLEGEVRELLDEMAERNNRLFQIKKLDVI